MKSESVPQKFMIAEIQDCDEAIREHLYALGFLPGKIIELVQICPLGDPMVVMIGCKKWALPRKLWDYLALVEKEGKA